MTKDLIPFSTPDISALARALGRELEACPGTPGHVQVLNMLARGVGYRNFQHLRASTRARPRLPPALSLQAARAALSEAPVPDAPLEARRILAVTRQFTEEGALQRWPKKASHRLLALWAVWARLPARRRFTEREMTAVLAPLHAFHDPALIRRNLVEAGLMTRTRDGSVYQRIERRPPPEALALIQALKTAARG
ncbi:DUF2087 domain-containing protein [Pararhodospirillum oryzae]|uniref:DUF2087 domain-containing protein n=1 Tax=Pararhodospirillum oryzae TaxID=478448 RepID=A0A512H863_9PROT|nr:DUF2087 domain-containing protein [Pararhodospirillum oryzae]GEO81631.1 hypothetical protein ROR02_17620 [Pararhodospirillum oryzae]